MEFLLSNFLMTMHRHGHEEIRLETPLKALLVLSSSDPLHACCSAASCSPKPECCRLQRNEMVNMGRGTQTQDVGQAY